LWLAGPHAETSAADAMAISAARVL
jgi:hypothetical protein